MTDDELDAMLRDVAAAEEPDLDVWGPAVFACAAHVKTLVAEVRRLRASPPPFPPDLERMTGERFRGILADWQMTEDEAKELQALLDAPPGSPGKLNRELRPMEGVETLPFNPPCVVFVPKG